MLYAILCYHSEEQVCAWSREREADTMARLAVVQRKLAAAGRLGPVARLMPTSAATTLRKDREPPLVVDGPFAETKEQLLGFYIVECATLDDAIVVAKDLAKASGSPGAFELRPLMLYRPGSLPT